MKKQTDIFKKEYQRLDKVYKLDEPINKNDRKAVLKKYNKSNLIYGANHSFYKYHDINEFDNLFLESKYSFLANFFNYLDKFIKLEPKKKRNKRKTILHIIQLQNYIITC